MKKHQSLSSALNLADRSTFSEAFKEFAEDEKSIELKLSRLHNEGRTLDELSLIEFCRIFDCHSAADVAYIYEKEQVFRKKSCTF